MKKFIYLIAFTGLILINFATKAQINESFTDGNFTSNPTWTGNTADWIVNTGQQLQSNNLIVNGSYYLSTPSTLATQTQWEMYARIDFNPSSLNYIDIFLTASASDISAANTTGYFVRIGNTDDEISLYRKDAAGVAVKIIDGVNATLNTSSNVIKIKVIRSTGNQWTLFRDPSGTGNSYVSEGTSADATYTTSSFFGFLIRQSTATFFQKHYFDDIVVAPYAPDVTPPTIQSAAATSPIAVDVLFNEPLDLATSQTVTNYVANNGIGSPGSAVRDATNSALVHLTYGSNFPNGSTNILTISGVKDIAGNTMVTGTTTFSFTVTPLTVQSVVPVSATMLDVLFNKAVDVTTSQTLANYSVNNGIGNPVSATRDATNTSLVHLNFATIFPNGVNNTITINNVRDLFGYTMASSSTVFSFYTAQRFDVVIDEIFADPTPVVSLPSAEFIEIKNVSGRPLNLLGWRVSNATSISGALPAYILPADSFLVITSTTNAPSFANYGRVLGVTSFPSLDNNGTTLSLISREGITIHSVSYDVSWYQNSVKSDGGWTLEMIDTRNPCNGLNNWKASTDLRGGTPAAKNSVDGVNVDNIAPALIRASAIDNLNIVLYFDEPLDSAKASAVANYTISDGINSPAIATPVSPMFNRVQLRLNTPIVRGTVYTVTANNIADCAGNVIQALKTARVGLPSIIDSFGIVINEILFNPKSPSVDFVEIYNRSNTVYDLKDLYIANSTTTQRQVSTDNYLLFPGDYFVISESQALVKQSYTAQNPNNFIDVSSMPSFSDAEGHVILKNAQGIIVDEVKYSAKWHFALIDNEEGISLERIDFNKPSQDQSNWHSAASTVGYATPSYRNSQFRTDILVQGEVTITPKIFSPDNDGFDDFAVIAITLSDPGYVANVTIFDALGRPVKNLVKNATLAQTGSFRWDGLNDKLAKVPVGTYVIYTEVFNLQGKKRSFKNTVVVAARF